MIVAALLLWGASAWALDRYGLKPWPREPWDAIVVPGCRVMPSGRPSTALRRRAELAVELWRAGLAPVVVFTGGVGDSPPSEAHAASQHALALGLDPAAVVLEDRSTTTDENARFAAALLGPKRVLVATDAYHVLRCERVFARHFPQARGVGSLNDPTPRAKGAAREVAALAWYTARRRA